ncbi:MAG: hypothetical protein E7502_03035 [Ruminococcus sp.]|nr:hypothetical protein [Ruminococcus sp.]
MYVFHGELFTALRPAWSVCAVQQSHHTIKETPVCIAVQTSRQTDMPEFRQPAMDTAVWNVPSGACC